MRRWCWNNKHSLYLNKWSFPLLFRYGGTAILSSSCLWVLHNQPERPLDSGGQYRRGTGPKTQRSIERRTSYRLLPQCLVWSCPCIHKWKCDILTPQHEFHVEQKNGTVSILHLHVAFDISPNGLFAFTLWTGSYGQIFTASGSFSTLEVIFFSTISPLWRLWTRTPWN